MVSLIRRCLSEIYDVLIKLSKALHTNTYMITALITTEQHCASCNGVLKGQEHPDLLAATRLAVSMSQLLGLLLSLVSVCWPPLYTLQQCTVSNLSTDLRLHTGK